MWLTEGERRHNKPRIGFPFVKGTVGQDGGSDVVDVLGRYGAEVAPKPDDIDESIDLPARLFRRRTEKPRLRQEVVNAGRATLGVASPGYHGRGHEVLGRKDGHRAFWLRS
jgi:hypothetical protein